MNRDRSNEISPMASLIGPLLDKLGVANISVLTELTERWDELAGSPWAGNSTPLVVRHGELVVEAQSTAGVRVMRYAAESLAKRLADHFGPDVVTSVRVVTPSR